ncbi:MAG: GspH/FimT family pseudopilin [Gammaproteobacteria bacterium]|nr:GspH/FimT family pseudopilin [Gammaproteobacteria bacterium]
MNPEPATKGFTLPELLIVMAVFAIAVTSIGPSLLGVMSDNRVASYSRILLDDLKLARHEAVMRGHRVMVCAITDGDTSVCSNAEAWQNGWMVFADPDQTGAPTADSDILRVQDPLPPSVSVKINVLQDKMYYSPSGRVHAPGNFEFTSNQDSAQARGRKITWDVFRIPTIKIVE